VKVLVAPDAAKGTATAAELAAAIAQGWRSVRPGDAVVEVPLADGGEGTADTIAAAYPGARWQPVDVPGPEGAPIPAGWWRLPDGTGVVDLAAACGLALYGVPDPTGASTDGLGRVLAAACEAGAGALVLGLGGSASTDGGTGALTALGARFLDADGQPLAPGGGALTRLARVDLSGLRPSPAGGVSCLVDIDAPLTGPRGAAHVFGPQKGADPATVTLLDRALARFAAGTSDRGVAPDTPGAGAAGGTGYGLAACWGAALRPGAATVAEVVGLAHHLADAGLVVTGEGRFDATSLTGKVVGYVLAARPAGLPAAIVAGQIDDAVLDGLAAVSGISLAELAGGVDAAVARPLAFAQRAGAHLAAQIDG